MNWSIGHSSGLLAFTIWGAFPLFWSIFSHFDALFVALCRFIFTALTLALVLTIKKEWSYITQIIHSKKMFLKLVIASLFITANWIIFIWAVAHNLTWQSSLGYYISPLFTVALGSFLLKERLSTSTKISLGFAVIGISIFIIKASTLPIVSLSLAITFSFYGYLKKNINITPHLSLAFEVFSTLPIFLGLIIFYPDKPELSHFDWIILSLSGPLTVVPMFCYNYAAQKIPLNNLGMLQFVSPTLQFLTSKFLFHETLDNTKLLAFIFIWISVINFFFAPFIWKHFRVKIN